MSELIQLVYASRSKLKATNDPADIKSGVARILTQSRRNNKSNNISGVLCHGDGCFFQCLEGDRDAVEALYERLHEDDRHRDVTLLLKRPVEARRFRLWAMKYLKVDQAVRLQIQKAGLDRFDPYCFDEPTIGRMLTVLQEVTPASGIGASSRESGQPAPFPRMADMLPLAYLGVGAVVFSLVAMSVLAFGVL